MQNFAAGSFLFCSQGITSWPLRRGAPMGVHLAASPAGWMSPTRYSGCPGNYSSDHRAGNRSLLIGYLLICLSPNQLPNGPQWGLEQVFTRVQIIVLLLSRFLPRVAQAVRPPVQALDWDVSLSGNSGPLLVFRGSPSPSLPHSFCLSSCVPSL